MDTKAKILIVEDEAPLRDLLGAELARSGFQVQTAANGREGLELYVEECFSVVLLDVKMPEMDGVEVLARMREHSDIPEVVMFTGHGDIETAVKCIKLGAYDYLTKPVKLEELELVISRANEKNRLRRENISLRQEISKLDNHQVVGRSEVMSRVMETVKRWGATDEHVLIHGASGTGKELIARAVHDFSPRKDKTFVTVNCGRLDANTAESELFGHMQGAFTGANKSRAGLFELADNGTLFMDEVSEMSLDVQVKLLRILETSTFRRLGGSRDIKVDVRFVFASNKLLSACVERGEFREDFYHRINLLPIQLPPLRERPDDILPLAMHFIKEATERSGEVMQLTDEALNALMSHHWPGNVRELKNTIRRACILATGNAITSDLLPFVPGKTPLPARTAGGAAEQTVVSSPLWEVEREHIGRVLAAVDGNKSQAAKILEIDRKTLYTKLDRYGLEANGATSE